MLSDIIPEFVHLPNMIIMTFHNTENSLTSTHFVRASGKIALTNMHRVHSVYRDVTRDNVGALAGAQALKAIMSCEPIYPLHWRCLFAFCSAFLLCGISFGGNFPDMVIGGVCASLLQYLGLSAVKKSTLYANVYE
jgi:uncharacterized membrane protein YjjP (DUF1212 family)